MYKKVNQLYINIYIYQLLFRFFSHIGHYRVLGKGGGINWETGIDIYTLPSVFQWLLPVLR